MDSLSDRHLVLEGDLLVDHFSGRIDTEVDALLAAAMQDGARCWIGAASLARLDAALQARLCAQGDEVAARTAARAAITRLLRQAAVLTEHGFEQADALLGRNLGQAQLAIAARVLRGQPACVVSRDPEFDALGEIEVRSPSAALAWLRQPAAASGTMPFIDVAAQQAGLRPRLEARMDRVLRHGQYIMGPEVRELEEQLEDYTEARHCISVASGTEALLISMMALGIGPGDEVVTTPFTFAATVETIVLLGARPVFVDIESDTCNIDAMLLEAAITPRTRAIIPVSLYGQAADMDAINAIAARHGGIPVIEDAAQSFGADYRGRRSCNLSGLACTSFFPSKPLGCYGDGGAIFTSDDALAQTCREIRIHGQGQRYVHTRVGVGGRMDTLQCAVLLAKLERFDEEVMRRRENGARYNEELDREGIPRVVQRGDRTSMFAQLTVFCDDRSSMQEALRVQGIPTAVHYPLPLNRQPAYSAISGDSVYAQADRAAARVMSLPMSASLRAAEIRRVVQTVAAARGS